MFILNAFSLNMVAEFPATVNVKEISRDEARRLLAAPEEAWGWLGMDSMDAAVQCAVGHTDTAAVFSDVLGLVVPCNRATVALKVGDVAIVGQYIGPRLPEGATTLPEGAQIKWLKVEVVA